MELSVTQAMARTLLQSTIDLDDDREVAFLLWGAGYSERDIGNHRMEAVREARAQLSRIACAEAS